MPDDNLATKGWFFSSTICSVVSHPHLSEDNLPPDSTKTFYPNEDISSQQGLFISTRASHPNNDTSHSQQEYLIPTSPFHELLTLSAFTVTQSRWLTFCSLSYRLSLTNRSRELSILLSGRNNFRLKWGAEAN